MANKEFLVSVADVWGYDESDNLVLSGKTLVDSSIETTLGNTDIRGGKGNQLQHVFYHSAEMNISIMEAQFDMQFIASAVGSQLGTGADVYNEETVTLGAGGTGTVAGTPIAIQGATLYGWVTLTDGTVERVTFTGSAFTASGGSENDVVCVRYYNTNAAAKTVSVPANIVPGVLRLVLDTQLASSDVATNIIGKVEIIVPKATLTGAFSLTMTADGVSQTPLNARALAFTPSGNTGCASAPVYAYIRKVLNSANWYDDCVALAFVGGDVTLGATLGTNQTLVKAIHSDGSVSVPDTADLTFASDSVGVCTISAAGLITGVAAGTTYVSVTITSKTSIDAAIEVTVPA